MTAFVVKNCEGSKGEERKMKEQCKHKWVTWTTTESDVRCEKCKRYGRVVRRHVDGRERTVIRANRDR